MSVQARQREASIGQRQHKIMSEQNRSRKVCAPRCSQCLRLTYQIFDLAGNVMRYDGIETNSDCIREEIAVEPGGKTLRSSAKKKKPVLSKRLCRYVDQFTKALQEFK